MRYILVSVIVSSLAFAAVGGPSHAADYTLRVDPQRELGAVPGNYRPSVMLSWADKEAISALMDLPGPLGTVRMTLEPQLSESKSMQELRSRLAQGGGAGLRALEARGARIIITVARTPRWLASVTSEAQAGEYGFTRREASPPRSAAGFEELGYEIVRTITVQHRTSPLYEFWNEPESKSFWSGSSADLFQAYDAFVRGARRADPRAKVGGIAVGGWNVPRAGEGTEPMLRAFVRHAAQGIKRGQTSLDFLTWHNFVKTPDEGWNGARAVRGWLREAGLPDLPQFVTEWNLWRTFPQWLDPSRDTAEGAVLLLAAHEAIADSGLTGHTIAALQDFNPAGEAEAYAGDFGLVTRSPMLRKASFCAIHMLSKLGERHIAVGEPAEVEAAGISVIATAGRERIVVLAYRRPMSAQEALNRALRRSGIRSIESTGLTTEEVKKFILRRVELPARTPGNIRQALEHARAAAEHARDRPAKEVVLRLAVADSNSSANYRIFRVDEQHCNPARVYRDLRRQGTAHAPALAAARQHESLKAVVEGSGTLPPLELAAYGAVLIEIERAARR
jgi:hypothetical protein